MSLKRDGLGCFGTLALTALMGMWTAYGFSTAPDADWPAVVLVLAMLTPFLYFKSPKRPAESVTRSSRRATYFHRTVRNEIGVDGEVRWWQPYVSKKVRVKVGDVVVPMTVKRKSLRKYPDVGLRLELPAAFPKELAFKAEPMIKSTPDSRVGDFSFDEAVQLSGPSAAWSAALYADLRDRLEEGVKERRYRLKSGRLYAEVHGLDLKNHGMEQVRELITFAADLTAVTATPVPDRLYAQATSDDKPLIRTTAFRYLLSLEPGTHRVEALRTEWLASDEAFLVTSAADQSPVDEAFAALSRLITDPETSPAHRGLAIRRIGTLEHDGVLDVLRSVVTDDAGVQRALAEELAKRGHTGGGLALAEEGGGELAIAGANEGDLALAEGAELSPARPPKQKA